MGISHSTLAMENRPEQDERMEERPEAEAGAEEASAGMGPAAGTLELEHQRSDDVPSSKRHTELLSIPKVDRKGKAATPAIRPGDTSTPATGTKSRTERKEERKSARKEEKRNRKLEKSARKAEESEAGRDPVRRKLDAALENAGSIESVILLEKEYKALRQDPSHRPNFYSLIDQIISNFKYIPHSACDPPAGEAERIGLEKLREEVRSEDAEAAGMEETDDGSAFRKRKLEELEEKRRALEEESTRKQKELEDEARRLRAVEEAERRAREQRSKNPKLQVPMEKAEKGATWFEQKATELVEGYIQAYAPQQKKSKEAAAAYASACKDSEKAQENFVSALQKAQDSAQLLQKSMGKALEAAIELGREEERAKLYTQAKEKCTRPEAPRVKARPQTPAVRQDKLEKEKAQKDEELSKSGKKYGPAQARGQPAEEEPGKEWREKISEDTWKVERTIGSDEKYLECTYYPFSPEWQEKVRKELLDLAHRGFAPNADGDLYPTTRFAWQLRSTREFQELNDALERDYGIRLVWKSQEVKGKSKAVDDWHCYPIGRGKMEKTSRFGVQYTIRGNLPPNKNMCSICWSEGHWKSECPLKEMVSELWEPALTVLVPEQRLRKYYPLRNIVCERYKDEKDEYQKYYPAVVFADYGAFSSKISDINKKKYKDAKMRSPEEYPEIEPPEDERRGGIVLSPEEAIAYAATKKSAKPPDQGQSMARHSEALLEMQDSAKKRRTKLLEKESKQEAIDVDEEPTSKKAQGKGQGSPTVESLPAGHWQNRPRRESLSPGSKEVKEALRQKLEEHKKEKLEEYHKKKQQEEEPKTTAGPGPDEAGSDPSSDETSESSDECDDPVQENPDGLVHME